MEITDDLIEGIAHGTLPIDSPVYAKFTTDGELQKRVRDVIERETDAARREVLERIYARSLRSSIKMLNFAKLLQQYDVHLQPGDLVTID